MKTRDFFNRILGAVAVMACNPQLIAADECAPFAFRSAAQLEPWRPLVLGDGAGYAARLPEGAVLAQESCFPLFLHNPTERSWSYITCDIPAGTLPADTRSLTLHCDLIAANPETMRLCISEGVPFGGACTRLWEAKVKTAGVHTRVSFTVPLQESQSLISLAVGFDYQSRGEWGLVDRIEVEGSAEEVEATRCREEEVEAFSCLALPEAVLNTIFPDAREMLHAQLARLTRQAPEGSPWQSSRQELLRKLEEAYHGTLPLAELPVLQAAIYGDSWTVQSAGKLTNAENCQAITAAEAGNLELLAPRNGRDSQLLIVDNAALETQSFEVEFSGIPAEKVRLSRLQRVGGVPDCPVPEQTPYLLRVAPDTTEIWEVEFGPEEMPAGVYRGALRLIPLDSRLNIREIPVLLQVAEVRLPEEMPITVFGCEYEGSVASDAFLQLMIAMRVNAVMVVLRDPDDFTPIHKMAEALDRNQLRDRVKLIFVEEESFRKNGFRPGDERWLDRLRANMRQAGFQPDQWVLHLVDETLGDDFVALARAVKAHAPEVRIFSDALGLHPYRPDMAAVEKIAPYVDYWCPHLCAFTKERDAFGEVVDFAAESGKPFWVYDCDSSPTFPFERAFIEPYVVFAHQLDGAFYWTLAASDFRPAKGSANFGMSYFIGDTPLPSRRWKLWRAALEDYLLLRQAAEKEPEAAKALAEKMIAHYNAGTLSQNAEVLRRELFQLLIPITE